MASQMAGDLMGDKHINTMTRREESFVRLIAVHGYQTDDPAHLTFAARATITARRGQDGNDLWYGNCGNRWGWFSPSYCRLQPSIRSSRHGHSSSFNGFPAERPVACVKESRSKSWNETLTPRDGSRPHSDSFSTAETRSLTPVGSVSDTSSDQECRGDNESATSAQQGRPKPPKRTGNSSNNVSSTEKTPKRGNGKPHLVLRLTCSANRQQRADTTSSRPALHLPAPLAGSSLKFRNFFTKDRFQRAPATLMPDVCYGLEPPSSCSPPTARKPHRQQEQEHHKESCPTHHPYQVFSDTEIPIDPIEVWAEEYRRRYALPVENEFPW